MEMLSRVLAACRRRFFFHENNFSIKNEGEKREFWCRKAGEHNGGVLGSQLSN